MAAHTGSGDGSALCRFCGTVSAGATLLPVGCVCVHADCQLRACEVCTKVLPCGHHCGGVLAEETCLPCLHPSCVGKRAGAVRTTSGDNCVICYSEHLSAAPAIQLACGHVYHKHCCDLQLSTRWTGPRITFRFLMCPVCEDRFIEHPLLTQALTPMLDLYEEVKRKALTRLEYEKQTQVDAITSSSSKFYKKPELYAMDRYAYYICYKCSKAYYGGGGQCAVQVAAPTDYKPEELVCGGCSNVRGAQVCPAHGTEYLGYKCRYCCTLAVFFCFGTTHFCTLCHNDHSRLRSMSAFPPCPVGPTAKQMDGKECPLNVLHPATGEEFALGCAVCYNALTF